MLNRFRTFARRIISPKSSYRSGLSTFPIGPVTVGADLFSPDEALKISSFWRCVNVLSDSVASLPWQVQRIDPDNTRRLLPRHHIAKLLEKAPNPEMTGATYKKLIVHNRLVWGNFYAEIEFNVGGNPMALWPLRPDRMYPWRDEMGKLWYRTTDVDTSRDLIEPYRIFHVLGPTIDGIYGLPILEVARQSIGSAQAAEQFTGSYFVNGMHAGGVIQIDRSINVNPSSIERIGKQLKKRATGVNRASSAIVLDRGMEWKNIASNPDNGQLLETRRFTVDEMCRWCGVPPYLAFAKESEARANFEMQAREFLKYGVTPVLNALRSEADRKLLGNSSVLSTRFDVSEFARTDPSTRAAYYREMRHMGVLSVNEIREMDGLDPIGPEGDVRVMQVQYQPIGPDGAPTAPVVDSGNSGFPGNSGGASNADEND